MLKFIYVIFDKVAGEAGPLFEAKNDAVAWRLFHTLLDKNKSVDPHELQLLKLGTFDSTSATLDATGKVEVFPTNEGLKDA